MTLASDIRAFNETETLIDYYRALHAPNQPHSYSEIVVCVPGISSRMRTCRFCGRSSYAAVHCER